MLPWQPFEILGFEWSMFWNDKPQLKWPTVVKNLVFPQQGPQTLEQERTHTHTCITWLYQNAREKFCHMGSQPHEFSSQTFWCADRNFRSSSGQFPKSWQISVCKMPLLTLSLPPWGAQLLKSAKPHRFIRLIFINHNYSLFYMPHCNFSQLKPTVDQNMYEKAFGKDQIL